MRVWLATDGSAYAIPAELAHVKITKSGWPDKRDRDYAAFMTWTNGVTEAVTQVVEPVVVVTDHALARAQAYAERIWSGQSIDLHRADRLQRVKAGLEAQGMSMEGVVL